MKSLLTRATVGILAVTFGLAALPSTSSAGTIRYHGPKRNVTVHTGHNHPRNYTVRYGYGWRGRGYYYGPVGVRYYYRTPGVVYYPTAAAVPATYVVDSSPAKVSLEASVQIELKNRGYYHGPIDGDIGPGSRSAISRYQAANGLKITGTITEGLVRSLGIE